MAQIDLGFGVTIEESDVNSGTGNYDSFLRIQNTGEEQGFNTDTPQQEDNKDGNFTHSLLISSPRRSSRAEEANRLATEASTDIQSRESASSIRAAKTC